MTSATDSTTISPPKTDLDLRHEFEKYLIDLDREKLEFCAQAVHELKSPLSIIRTTTDLIDSSDPAIQQGLFEINSQITRASSILHQLMTMMRLNLRDSNGVFIDATQVVSLLLRDFRPQLDSLEKSFLPVLPKTPITVPLSFELIAKNLIENALLHSQPGQIKITLSSDSDIIRFTVTDPGPPIPPNLHVQIFEKFFRGPNSKNGSGLGLYLVSQAVFQLDGEIYLSSSGQHNIFTVTLPASFSPQS